MAESEALIEVVVVGAGPAGLAVSACLKRADVPHALLERERSVAPAWRRHYDRLHLHTSRAFSSLPYRPMPRSFPRYPSRDQVVEYLEAYAQAQCVTPSLGVEVRSLERASDHWIVQTSDGTLQAKAVVVATGANGEAKRPAWPGLETFPGTIVHSSDYRNGGVRFRDGETRTFDAIVFATGYRPCLPRGVPGVRVDGHAEREANDHVGGASGLYFCGFYVSPTGMLREVGLEARCIVERVLGQIDRSGAG